MLGWGEGAGVGARKPAAGRFVKSSGQGMGPKGGTTDVADSALQWVVQHPTSRCSAEAGTAPHPARGLGLVVGLLTGPTKPSSPVLVKGLSETGTPPAVTGTVCTERRGLVRLWFRMRPRRQVGELGMHTQLGHHPCLPRGRCSPRSGVSAA